MLCALYCEIIDEVVSFKFSNEITESKKIGKRKVKKRLCDTLTFFEITSQLVNIYPKDFMAQAKVMCPF